MPTYPVKNLKTEEKKELCMTMKEYEQWRKDNPDWDKDWQAGVASAGEVGEWRDKLTKKQPGWGEILKKTEKGAGIKGRLANRGINVN